MDVRHRLKTLLSILNYLNFFFYRVICAKFPDEHRLFTDEDHLVHYLAVLNRDFPNMFVLLYVDEHNDSAVSIVVGNHCGTIVYNLEAPFDIICI